MQFKKELIPKIIDGSKTMTRRLVKENHTAMMFPHPDTANIEAVCIANENSITAKWMVGKTYAVQEGRGKKGVWYCPDCKSTQCVQLSDDDEIHPHIAKPLRIKITDIRQENLLDISEEDARAEGFKGEYPREEFLSAFVRINYPKTKQISFPDFTTKDLNWLGKGNLKVREGLELDEKNIGNPLVWRISFCVEGEK